MEGEGGEEEEEEEEDGGEKEGNRVIKVRENHRLNHLCGTQEMNTPTTASHTLVYSLCAHSTTAPHPPA